MIKKILHTVASRHTNEAINCAVSWEKTVYIAYSYVASMCCILLYVHNMYTHTYIHTTKLQYVRSSLHNNFKSKLCFLFHSNIFEVIQK